MLGSDDFVKAHLAAFLWKFRKLESINGMAAIGCVLRNRVIAGWHGGDWMLVLKDAMEQSGFTGVEFPDFRDPVFHRLIWKIESIFDNTIEDNSNDGKFWCHLPTATEEFKKTVLQHPEEHPRLANVGSLYFFG